jgi:hypothetical protein
MPDRVAAESVIEITWNTHQSRQLEGRYFLASGLRAFSSRPTTAAVSV